MKLFKNYLAESYSKFLGAIAEKQLLNPINRYDPGSIKQMQNVLKEY